MPEQQVPDRVTEHWGDLEMLEDNFGPDVYWMAHPRVVERYERLATRGSGQPMWAWAHGRFADPDGHVVSVGSGTGTLERTLRELGHRGPITGVEPSPGAIAEARRLAAGLDIEYHEGTLADFVAAGHEPVPCIVWNMALHHSFDPAADLELTARALAPGGHVVLNEYVGANHFAFPPAQVQLMRTAYSLLPATMRQSRLRANLGHVHTAALLPDPAEVQRVDPSEAVQADTIESAFRTHFTVDEWNPCGGQLLQFLLHQIAGNFTGPEGDAWLDVLFALEDAAHVTGTAPADFVFAVGHPRR